MKFERCLFGIRGKGSKQIRSKEWTMGWHERENKLQAILRALKEGKMSSCHGQQELLLEVENISKTFPGVNALKGVRLQVKKGTVHALLGENGAGKSTLMKIILGMYARDSGTIRLKGREIHVANPRQALDLGISMIHQELMSIMDMSVADNMFLGGYPGGKIGLLNRRKIERQADAVLKDLGIEGIRACDKMSELSQAKRQMVEIAKAVLGKAELIIMDEPTSSLSESETERLFKIIGALKEKGMGMIYISHKLEEIFEITDEYTVFRDGVYIGTGKTKEVSQEQLVQMMVGRSLSEVYSKCKTDVGDVVLEVEGLSSGNKFQDVSFELRSGEILGISGLVGSGRTELVETIVGLRRASAGKIRKNGKELRIKNVKDAVEHGISLATEDRKRNGLFLSLPISFNISIAWLDKLSRLGLIKRREELRVCQEYAQMLKVKTNSLKRQIATLSGGNQQKVVLAKWLLTDADVLILDEPTRGIDIGAKAEIYALMEQIVSRGKSIIMVSSEMPEIMGMSDRILVMHEGKVKGIFNRDEISQAQAVGYE